ncbi:hypothetical protein CPT_Palo_035 [Rhizobium phage Palo]|uniref:Uncharacterized protein n=1 Tax=Rhizobium phage Palo TaxID=2767573 RepID=A0A7L8G4K6_9CAUD|nr:hypothetical protein CPT_Palo_035 [Rhizobium phage Palo]
MAYEHLSDEDKVLTAIEFVAQGAAIPPALRSFLEDTGLYELITNPIPNFGGQNEHSQRNSG